MRRFALLVLPLLFFAAVPFVTQAASATFFGPLISPECTCPGVQAPGWGCVLQTIQNAINFGIALACILVVLVIIYAGFLFMRSAVNPEMRSQARNVLINAIVGLVIVLAAWLIVDFVMKTLYNPSATFAGQEIGPWNAILSGGSQCIVATAPHSIFDGPSIFVDPGTGAGSAAEGGAATAGIPPSNKAGTDKLNTQAAINYLVKTYTPSSGTGHCLSAIQYAFSKGGISLSCPSGYAGKCNGSLQSLGFQSLGSSDSSPQPGDIVVIQHTTGNRIGHIAMFTGTYWISDFVQSNTESPPGNPYPASQVGGVQYWRP